MSPEQVELTRLKSPFFPRLEAIDRLYNWHTWQGIPERGRVYERGTGILCHS